jgi:hypothetical protein
MKRLFGLAVCLAIVLALNGCKKSDSDTSSKKSSGPSGGPPSGPPARPPGGPPSGPPGYPGRGPGPSSDAGTAPGAAQPQPEVMPEPEEPDDHSDDPWFDHEKGKTPAGEGEKKPAGAASGWEPDKALLEQLEPYQDVDGYQVRPPRGYASIQPPTPPGSKVFSWAGMPRADGTAPIFTVLIATPTREEAKGITLENFVERMLAAVKALRQDWQQTPAERGQVNGLSMLRTTWQGTAPQGNFRMRGFDYFAQDGGTFICIRSQDVAPHGEQALKLAEAAALTFRKK